MAGQSFGISELFTKPFNVNVLGESRDLKVVIIKISPDAAHICGSQSNE